MTITTAAAPATYTITVTVDAKSASTSLTISPKPATITGVTAAGKIYDGTTTATLSGGSVAASIINGDTVTVVAGTGTGTFGSRNAGSQTVTASGYSLGGANAAKYTLSGQPTVANATITQKALTVSGLTASDKAFDGTTTATLTGTAVFQTAEAPGAGSTADGIPYTADSVTVGGTASGAFATSSVGLAKPVTVSGLTVAGTGNGNYSVTQPSLTADIYNVRLGNRVWLDNGAGGGTSNDGLINGTEAGINGVTVTVYAADAAGYATGSVLKTTTTAAGGYYGFNLPAGDYVVVIPASNFGSGKPLVGLYSSGTSNNTRNGADPDTNATDSDDNGFNAYNPSVTGVYSAAITLTVGGEPTGETDLGPADSVLTDASTNLTLDFGFVAAAPTAIKLSYVKGWWIDGRVTVEWETVSELNTLGFELYRLQGSDRIRVNADLVPALNVERGGVYRVDETMDRPTTTVSYILVEQETTGNRIEYGPFGISIQLGAKPTSARVVSGALVLRFAGEAAAEYQIESTDDLANGHWVPVGRLTADPSGTIEYQQRLVESEPVRFYRALRP